MVLDNTQERSWETDGSAWHNFYLLAGVGLVVSIVFVLLDIGLSFTGGDLVTGSTDAAGWFSHFQSSWFVGLRNLGLFNVINAVLSIPLYLVLYQLHRRQSPAFAVLALSLFLLGSAVYIANNRALSMLTLSQQYASAGAGQKALLEAAGTAILAQAEDFTPGSFSGLFINNLASLLMMTVMLRGQIFRRWLSVLGLVGMACLLAFTISVTFIPATFNAAMLVAMVGGLCMLAWTIGMALVMFRLWKTRSPGAVLVPAN